MKKFILFIICISAFISCIEEVDLGIESDDEVLKILIVEATLTNEIKNHKVTLSRMDTIVDLGIDSVYSPYTPIRDINRDLVRYETNATVSIESDNGTTYSFNETSAGIYESDLEFAAEIDNTYQLSISTSDGKRYSSTKMQIEGLASISNIYAEKTTSESGAQGIGIFVDNTVASGNVQNLRYTYDETYKVIAPNWTPEAFKLTNYEPCALPLVTYDLEIVEREEEQQVCYGNNLSNTIIQAQQSNLGSNIKKFMVRFIDQQNFIISHRYSVEIEQLVSSAASFSFYDQLNNFSQTGSIFSQVQPGFLQGNLSSDDGGQGTVIGFFDVLSVSRNRVFFNYTDFYPEEELPPYPFNCRELTAPESHVSFCFSGPRGPNPCPQSVIQQIDLNLISYVKPNVNDVVCGGPHIFVPRVCGDCTVLGGNVKPDFWVE
ncbi:DUF4249 domain-containing protein [Maribacter sp. BPC-D8]|uniref:DUF4249 domain-containing protein n=1 Tax=Maribacter sp. BPC-D8 TaxID=3053613 RepID=UPI002B494671|nr:DUF4249 domain-containing protein [Maribacter sp. BPC-D8]WRI28460.1 DUF4249 domain-containing protein [Maribacter sp. BPC-D8]